MKKISYWQINTEGVEIFKRYLLPARYENYEDAKAEVDRAWEKFLPYLEEHRKIIYEYEQRDRSDNYFRQIVMVYDYGFAEILKITIRRHTIPIR